MRLNQLLSSVNVACIGTLSLLSLQLNAGNILQDKIPAKLPYSLVSSGKQMNKLSGATQTYEVKLPAAANFYDFDGNGSMGFANVIRIKNWDDQSGNGEYLYLYNGISEEFSRRKGFEYLIRKEWYGDVASTLCGLDNLNGDDYLDFGIRKYEDSKGSSYTGFALLSKEDGSYVSYPANLLNNWDADADGRIDLISEVKKNSSESAFYIHRHQPNGDFVKQYMKVMTYSDYTNNFDPTAWSQLQESSSIGKPTPPVTGGSFSGAWLDPKSPAITSKLPIINLDLNRDGYPDLLDPGQGTIYYGTSDGAYILSSVGGSVVSKDLNSDGISDFIIHGGSEGILKTLVYQGGGDFKETQLMDNLAADDDIYCYDFDQDGDVDMLVTFSSHQTDGTAYTMFYENDGKGNFTAHEDQVSRKWLFSNCRDVDNDGYYDLLLLDYSEQDPENATATLKVMLRKGLTGFKFADAEELFRITVDQGAIGEDNWDFSLLKSLKVNAEDLDRDGYTEIWLSDISLSNYSELNSTFIYKVTANRVNSAPSRPEAPQVLYQASTGKLNLDWTASNDRECSAKDLTYELRIGTKPGSGDKVYAHANAAGLRRNFLDGNA